MSTRQQQKRLSEPNTRPPLRTNYETILVWFSLYKRRKGEKNGGFWKSSPPAFLGGWWVGYLPFPFKCPARLPTLKRPGNCAACFRSFRTVLKGSVTLWNEGTLICWLGGIKTRVLAVRIVSKQSLPWFHSYSACTTIDFRWRSHFRHKSWVKGNWMSDAGHGTFRDPTLMTADRAGIHRFLRRRPQQSTSMPETSSCEIQQIIYRGEKEAALHVEDLS